MKKHTILSLALAITLTVTSVFSLGTLKADENITYDDNIYHDANSGLFVSDFLEDLRGEFFGYGYYEEFDLNPFINDDEEYLDFYYPEYMDDSDLDFDFYGFDTFDSFYEDGDYDDDYNKEVPIIAEDSEARTEAIKNILSKLIPADKLKRIQRVEEFSDGKDEILAYVEMTDNSGKNWKLAYDPADVNLSDERVDKRDIIRTLIHEYAHIESLNDTQIDHGIYKPESGNIVLEEGTAKEKSYINQFANKFWTKKMLKKQIENPNQGEGDELYDDNPEDFVSVYASTNVAEDFAESFAAFVLRDKVTDGSIASKKIEFFYDFPELLELRNHMRKAINDIK